MMMVNLSEEKLVLLVQLLQKEVDQKLSASANPTADFDGAFEGGLLRKLIAARTALVAHREATKADGAAKKVN